ncbi:Glutathione S-transferase [Moritella sp. JT01]|nr:Glutathione S-transferase [Moritella sp. JT01]
MYIINLYQLGIIFNPIGEHMSLQQIELISFELCPFVLRSVITLKKKGIDFNITFIDLENKPEWFLKISPLGKVPVLKYGADVIFESAVINEFLDEISPPMLMPADPLQKAKDRGWIEYASALTVNQYMLTMADSKSDFDTQRIEMLSKLQRLENVITGSNFFNNVNFSLVDAALAPLLYRFTLIEKLFGQFFLHQFPKLQKISDKIVEQPYVKGATIDDFEMVFIDYLKNNNSYLSTLISKF